MSAPPHDLAAETDVLGYLLLRPRDVGGLFDQIRPEDFYSPAHAGVFAAIEALHRQGVAWDVRAVATEAERAGLPVTTVDLMTWMADAPTHPSRRPAWLVELRARRELLRIASEAEAHARDMAVEVGAAVEQATVALGMVSTASDDLPASFLRSSDIAREEDSDTEWLVPGLLARGHRAVVVGFEGHGKSALLAQVGWCASQGLHPFSRKPADPVRVLHVDLENPKDRIKGGYRTLLALCERTSKVFDDNRHYTLTEPGGLDLRVRRDRNKLEAVLARFRPDLVCLGPLRKSFQPAKGENDERAALAIQAIYDDLRTRYGFALLLEHHAPHGDSLSASRKARPMGSSTWLGWSEFGYGMQIVKDRPGVYELERWRLDRVKAFWPDELHRGSVAGSPWFWDGYWTQGGA